MEYRENPYFQRPAVLREYPGQSPYGCPRRLENGYEKYPNPLKEQVGDTGIEPAPTAVVSRVSVTASDQIDKATSAWELSWNPGMDRGRGGTIATIPAR